MRLRRIGGLGYHQGRPAPSGAAGGANLRQRVSLPAGGWHRHLPGPVRRQHRHGAAQVVVEIGTRLPLHATAQGKLLLSRLSDSEALSRLSAAGMPAFTPHTITEPQRLMAALADIRRAGCAVEDGEYKIGLRAAAAPVLDRGGQLRYALGVVGLFRRVASEEFQRAMAETIRQAVSFPPRWAVPRMQPFSMAPAAFSSHRQRRAP